MHVRDGDHFLGVLEGRLGHQGQERHWIDPAAIELTHRNTRRYGGYLVHMGIVFMFIGYTGAAFNQDVTKEVSPGGSFNSATTRASRNDQGENDNYVWQRLTVDVIGKRKPAGTMVPERRFTKPASSPLRKYPSADA